MQNIEDIYPLSPLQQGMLFHTLLHEGSGVYLMQDRYRLAGEIDEAAFLEAWRLVVKAHPALRASFQWKTQKQALQVIHREVDVPVEQIDLRGLSPDEQEQRIRTLLDDEQRVGSDLARPPLIRFRLVRLADAAWEFIRSFHHILMDAWCISLVMVHALEAYEALRRGEAPRLPAPRPYRDYILWLKQQDPAHAETFWREQLQGFGAPTPLVVDSAAPRNRYTRAVRVDDRSIELGEDTTQSLHAFCRARRITPNTFFQGAWALLLARYAAQGDVLFGVTVAGRPPELAGVEEMIGLFINTLPLRVRVDADVPLTAWLSGLQDLNLRMRDFEHTPLTDIQAFSAVPRGEALFDSILVYENAPIDQKILAGDFSFRLEGMDHGVHTHYGLTVVVMPGARLGVRISYDRDRFDASTIDRMLQHLGTLVLGMLAAPEAPLAQFELLAPAERQQLLQAWAVNPQALPIERSYAALFAEQLAQRPQQPVAVCDGEQLTYAELDRRSTRLAHALRAAGAGPETIVALAAPRGLELLTMMVAVFKVGAAMLPLEVGHPPQRLRELLQLSQVPLLVASQRCASLLDELLSPGLPLCALLAETCWVQGDDAPLPLAGSPDSLAYVLFTSGSTGTPKAVMIEQRGMLNNIFGKVPALGLGEQDRIAQTASVAFDISVWQFLAAPVLGATVHILPDDVAHDPQRLAQAVEAHRLTVLEIVPSLMRLLIALCPPGLALRSLRWLLPTGEALPPTVARDWLRRFAHIPLMNAYGPAECADDVAFYPLRTEADIVEPHMPIGRPTANNALYVLDEALRPLPVGVPGEICIGGTGVGRGYLHDEARTRERFVPCPAGLAASGWLYRSGDIGRWRADGMLEYLGRADQQVKLRGQRIELGEIEHSLCRHPAVEAAAVLVRPDRRGDAQLVAYWQHKGGTDAASAAQLTAHLAAWLPAAMVPALFVELPALPLNANGKVDRKALAARPLDAVDTPVAVAPRNDTELAIHEIWCQVLGRNDCGVEDNFFAVGGHSLLATQLVARVRLRFKLELPLRALFEQPTVAGLARAVDDRLRADAPSTPEALLALVPPPRPAVLPLSFAQQRLWFIEQLQPGSTLFNIPFALRLQGPIDVPALEASFNALIERHEVLRTSLAGEADAPFQRIAPPLRIGLPITDLSLHEPAARAEAEAALLKGVFETPFDLGAAPLLRAQLVRRSAGDHVLAIALHHIVSDAWSATIALRELAEGYTAFQAGRTPAFAPLPIQYADFALWQREQLQGAELARQLAHWQRVLALPGGREPLLPLPTDHPRPPQQSHRVGLVRRRLSSAANTRLQAFSAQLGLTPFSAVFAAFAALMQRVSGETTVLIGTPVTQRERPQTEGLLGMLLNNLVVRTDFDDAPGFATLARRVGQRLDEARRHQDLPFERLVEALELPRRLSHAPLYQVMVAQQLAMERLPFGGLQVEALDTPLRQSECDLDLHVVCPPDGPVELELLFALDLFREQTAERWLAALAELLDAMLDAPEQAIARLPFTLAPLAIAAPVAQPLMPARDDGHALTPPQGDAETRLATLWADVLQQPLARVGRETDFFRSGGHSLLAATLFARLRQHFAQVPPLRAIFEEPTLAGFAARLGAPRPQPLPAWAPAERPQRLPLSAAQQRLWLLQRLAEGGEYNVTTALRLQGALDATALQCALQTVVRRHEILRSRIVESDAGPELRVIEHEDLALPVVRVAPADWTVQLREAPRADSAQAFDLAQQPPLRARLLCCDGTDDHLLLLTLHHSVTDDFSTQVLLEDLAAAYRGDVLPPLAVQYADYALWQQSLAQQAQQQEQLAYWRRTLEDGDYVLDLPTDHPRAARPAPAAAAVHTVLPPALRQRLHAFAQDRGVTLYMLLLAATQWLLGRHANQRDIRIATPVSSRPRPELQRLVGCFVNTLVMRADADPAISFDALLSQVRERVLDAQAHQDVPFEQVVEALAPPRDLGRAPLAQVLFVMQNAAPPADGWPGLHVTELPVEQANAKIDLNWEVHDGEALSVMLEYRAALFERSTVERWLADWQTLLEDILAGPDRALRELSLLSAADRRLQLIDWNATDKTYPGPKTLSQALVQQAASTPDATALVFEGDRLSYAELHARADHLAAALRAAGVGAEQVVAVCMERSVELVVALLGIVKAGAACLPLDTSLPPARLALLLDDAQVRITLAQLPLVARLPSAATVWTLDALPAANAAVEPANTPSDLAYVLYTSGSTGLPKGVLNEHGGLMNRLHWMQDAFPIGAGDRVLQKTPYGFDVSVWEFFWPLITGATLVLARPDGHRDPAYLAELIAREHITTLHFVPSMLRAFVDEPGLARCDSLRQVFASGEALPADLVQRFMARHPAALVNLYGPTEAAIDVSVWRCVPGTAVVPIGKPIANLRLYVLDDALQPLPIGAIGELYIGGIGVARGYLNRPELTAERFLPSPYVPGERLYRTGDRCRFRRDGEIEYLGRLDHQVKLRGQRIELGEIDAALRAQPGVRDAATLLREQRLVAFWCGEADESALRDALSQTLPPHMLPSRLVQLPALPLNVNGKLDRKALAALPLAEPQAPATATPRTPQEQALCALFAELLQRPAVGIGDHFFALGGHSLLATQLVARIRERLGLTLPLATVFEHPTVQALAAQLDKAPALEAIERQARPARLPLGLAQRRFWLLSQLDPASSDYHMPFALALHGPLNVDALRQAIEHLTDRHLVLRSRIVAGRDSEPELLIDPEGPPLVVRTVPGDWQAACAEAQASLLAPFNLATTPPWRTLLLQRAGHDEALLLLAVHHSAADGWAVQKLQDELAQAYGAIANGRRPALPPQAIDFVDHALWQRQPQVEARRATSLAHWKALLGDGRCQLALPTDRPRSAELPRDAGRVARRLGATRAERVRRLASERRSTPHVVLAAALAALLARCSGQPDIRIGMPTDQRERPETQTLMASLVNTLVLKLDVGTDTSGDALLTQVEQRLREAQAHAELPFEHLVTALDGARETGRTPLFQVLFTLQHGRGAGSDWLGLAVTEQPVPLTQAKFEQSWELHDDGDNIALELEYQAALYDAATMERWADAWLALVDALVADARRSVADLCPRVPDASTPPPAATQPSFSGEHPEAALARTIARLFADVLGPELIGHRTVGADDGFFALGGDSILGLKLIARLREHGHALAPKDLFRAPTPAGLARLATPLAATGEQGELQGNVPLMPIQHWFLSQQQPRAAHWNQSVLADSRRPLQATRVRAALQALVAHHDALRLRFRQVQGEWQASYAPAHSAWRFVETSDVAELGDLAASFDLAQGPLFAAALVHGTPQRLYVAAHHLVVDAVSWQVLLEDFQRFYETLERGDAATLAPKTSSYRQWAEQVQAVPATTELAHWQAQAGASTAVPLPAVAQCSVLSAKWDAPRTRRWLTEAHAAYRTRPEELLVAALTATLSGALAKPEVVIELERHGRDGNFDGLDASRTVGWFTTLFPVRIASRGEPGERIREAKASLRGVPGQGLGHGVLRQRGLLPASAADVLFNHLGHEPAAEGWLQPSTLAAPQDVDPRNRVTHQREVITWLQDGVLHVEWRTVHPEADATLPQALLDRLDALVDHCLAPEAGALMPQDFPLAKGLNQKTLDRLLKQLG